MPIETLLYAKQEGYYKALNALDTAGESTVFVTFMLEVIRDALKDVVDSQNRRTDVGVNVVTNEEKVLTLLNLRKQSDYRWYNQKRETGTIAF